VGKVFAALTGQTGAIGASSRRVDAKVDQESNPCGFQAAWRVAAGLAATGDGR